MLMMLARRGDVELVRDICDWLIGNYKKDVAAGALEKGATREQATTVSQNAAAGLYASCESINDRNVGTTAMGLVDTVFQRHYNNGKAAYDKAMLWFANELRKKVKD